MTRPGILPSPLRDWVGCFDLDRYRGYKSVHLRFGLLSPCLRFAAPITGPHAKLGTRLLAKLYRGRHFRRLDFMRLQGATRTDPDVPNSGIRLLSRVIDEKANTRPRVKDARSGMPVISEFIDPLPRVAVLLATLSKRAPTEALEVTEKCAPCLRISRHGMVAEKPFGNLRQPSPLFRDWLRHAPSSSSRDLLELRPHAVTLGPPFDQEGPLTATSTYQGEAQEIESFRFAQSPSCPVNLARCRCH